MPTARATGALLLAGHLAFGCSDGSEGSGPVGGGTPTGVTTTSDTGGTGAGASAGGSGGGGAAGFGGGGAGAAAGAGGDLPSIPYACPESLDPCPAFPTAAWPTATPGAVGLDAAALDGFVAATGNQQGVVVRFGYLARSWGSESDELEWASASKPVWSTFLFFAVQEGLLTSVDDLVADRGWALRPAHQGMTYRHLANQTSGYALPEASGAAWAYNDYAIKLYALTLFERVFSEGGADQIAAPAFRFGLLGFQDGDLFALVNGAPRVTTSPRDFARVGWLWANLGRWGQTQLLAPGTLRAAWQPGVAASVPRTSGGTPDDYLGIGTAGGGADQTGLGPGVYGFNFWLNPGGQTWPAAPADTVQANGHWNGEVLTVIPSLGLVAAWRGQSADSEAFNQPMNAILAALVAAVVD